VIEAFGTPKELKVFTVALGGVKRLSAKYTQHDHNLSFFQDAKERVRNRRK
jgi:hypothetical protein